MVIILGINDEKINKVLCFPLKVNLSNKIAGGGFISTPKDLVNMLIHLDSLLSPINQKQLFTPQPFENGQLGKQNYGFGFRIHQVKKTNKTLLHHGGTSIGGRSFLLKVMEDDLIIVPIAILVFDQT